MSKETQVTDRERLSDTSLAHQPMKDPDSSVVTSHLLEREVQVYREDAARNQHFLVVLNQLAVETQLARTPAALYRIISDPISQLGYHVAILNLDIDQHNLAITYLSDNVTSSETIKQLAGLSIQSYRIPIKPGSFFQ